MKSKSRNNAVSYFDMQFITSSISTTLVLLLLGLVVFFVLAANNLSVYVRENINFSVLISDDMKETDILKLQSPLLHRESRFLHVYVGTAFCQQPADTPATVGAVPYRW